MREHLRRPLRARVRVVLLVSIMLAAMAATAPAASASHLQGGYFTAGITTDGHLKGTLTYLELTACTSGVGSQKTLSYTLTTPNTSYSRTVVVTATRCDPTSSVYTGTFDITLSSLSLGGPDGIYVLDFASSALVAGISNFTSSSSYGENFKAQVRKIAGQATAAPNLGSNIATGIAIGQTYSQNLNAQDPDGGTLTYATETGVPYGPTTDVVTLDQSGNVTIPSTRTATFTPGQYYLYRAKVTDSQGDYAQRTVLLRVGAAGNDAPVISGLSSSPYTLVPGEHRVISFSANDADTGDVVRITGAGLPAWAVLAMTPGNPAQATLTLDPPSSVTTDSYGMNFDATDNATVPLTGSRNIQVVVQADPQTTVTAGPTGLTGSAGATFDFSSNDPKATFECKLDGASAYTPCTRPKAYTGLAEGVHEFWVRAVDIQGFPDRSPASRTWTVDLTPPDTSVTSGPPSLSASRSAAFVLASTQAGSTYECRLDGAGSFSACTNTPSYSALADGSHTLQVRSTDAAGNVDASPAAYTWTVDATAPQTSIPTGPAARTQSTSATITLASSETGSTFECALDSGTYVSCSSPQTFTGLSDGSHTVLVRATDPAGNLDATPAAFTWIVDTTAPQTTISTGPDARTQSPSATITFASSETGSTFECSLDGSAYTACSSPENYTGLLEGSHTVNVRATDPAGNLDATPASHTWIVDTSVSAPTLLVAPADEDSSADFGFDGETGATFECRVDGGPWTACVSPHTETGLADGLHTFSVRQTDLAGNVSAPANRTWTLDTTATGSPVITTAPAAVSSTSHFAFTGEAGSTFECLLDTGGWSACSSPFDPTELADGEHTLQVREIDRAGNASVPVSRSWTLDTTAPGPVMVLAGPPGRTDSSSASFTFTGEPGAMIECRLDGGAWAPCPSPAVFAGLALGSHLFEVRQTDVAGNVSMVRQEGWTVVAPPVADVPDAGAPAKLTAVLPDVVEATGSSVAVGCRFSGAVITRCSVKAYVRVDGKLVLIGEGLTKASGADTRVAVNVTLNAAGRRYVNRLGGARVTFKMEATRTEGAKLHDTTAARVLPARVVVIPAAGLFAFDSARLSSGGARFLRRITSRLTGVKRLGCVGHTDTAGPAGYNRSLGQRRAQTVCSFLTRRGVQARMKASSEGETRPRARNVSRSGRALNRRVELLLRYS